MNRVKFNEPFITGNEAKYIAQVIANGHYCGNGDFTVKCQEYCQNRWNLGKCLMTHSGTGALEMAALLLDIEAGDEVIIPSFTFTSTALAFQRQGAKIIFADVKPTHPCLDENELEQLISPKTKAIVVVHYGGIACDMDKIMEIAATHNIAVVEDAAHAIGGTYKKKPLGGIGHIACFSFHESKNIHCGEGGMLVLNDPKYIERAEIIWEKGTNKAAFQRGAVAKYECVDVGSSFLASELLASFLFAQLEQLDKLQLHRDKIWNLYFSAFSQLGKFRHSYVPDFAEHNSHIFYILAENKTNRDYLIKELKSNNITAAFHYQSLHRSPYFLNKHDQNRSLTNSCPLYTSDAADEDDS